MINRIIQNINNRIKNSLIARKIQLITFSLLILFFIVMAFIMINFISTTQDEIQKKFENSSKSVDKALQFYKKNLINIASLIAENPDIYQNLMLSKHEPNVKKLINALALLQEKSPVQYSWIYNAQGEIVASGHDPFNTIVLYDMDNTLFQHAIHGKSVYTIDSPSFHKMILKIAVPIYLASQKNTIIGVCILGINLDAAFASVIRDISGVDIFFLEDERLISTSFGSPEEYDKDIFISKTAPSKFINGVIYDIYHTAIWASEYIPNFSIALAIDNSQLKNELKDSLRMLVLLFMLAGLMIYFLSNKITKMIVLSLNNVIKGAKKISQKDFSYRIVSQTEDEIGLLGETFNYMAEEIEDYAKYLKQSENRFRQIIELSPYPILILSQENIIEYVNPEFTKVLGYEIKDLSNTDLWIQKALPDETQRNKFLALKKHASEDLLETHSGASTIIFEMMCKDSSFRSVIFRLVNMDNQKKFIILEDITERKIAEEELKESKDRYQMLFDSMFNGFSLQEMIFDEQGKPIDYTYIQVNPAFEKLTGLKREFIIGRKVSEIIPDIDQDWLDAYSEVAKTGKSKQFEFYSPNIDKYYDVFAFSHKKGMFATLFNDVTERKKREYEIRKFSEELETRVKERTAKLKESLEIIQNTQDQLVQAEKLAALGSLVAGVAHEINTPIGIGVTAASYLDQKTKDLLYKKQNQALNDTELQKYIDTAVKSSNMIMSNLNRAAELIQNFKQVAVDQTSEQNRTFNIKEYLDSILLSLHPQLKKTKHSIQINCDEQMTINSYPGVFSQIFTNFIINSLMHGFENKEKGEITIDIEKKNNIIYIKYTDNGSGIPEEILPKIFDPFFTTKRGQGGSGLGLHIVFNLVTAKLNGKIECHSKLGEYTVFLIQIPDKLEKKNAVRPQ